MQQSPSEKITHPHLAKKFPFYGPCRFTTVFTTPCHFSLSQPNEYSPHPPTQFKINFNIIFQSTPRSSKWFLFLKYCHQEPVWIFYSCPAYLIILELMTEIISHKYKSWSSSLCSFLQPSLTQISRSAPHLQPMLFPWCERRGSTPK